MVELSWSTKGGFDLPDPDEKPKDWYCQNCSEVVPIGERCRACGKTETDDT